MATDVRHLRDRMVDVHIAGRGIRDPRVLAAMRQVPREAFVDPGLEEFAYEDNPLPIEEGQTISQPYIVALMLEASDVGKDDRVLEVGAGSGYAAAVAAQLARQVYAIERHPSLAAKAAERIRKLGYSNAEIRPGDGTQGWPDDGQFDVILVAAGGQQIPQALKQQLKIGGRLVIPVGLPDQPQELVKLTKRGESDFEEEHLGAVRFVPLVGSTDWVEDGRQASSSHTSGAARGTGLPGLIAESAERLPDFDDSAFGALFDRYADRRVVLLGEASHGTSEFYRARAAITRRLIEQHGFSIVAVEADWPDAAAIDRYVRCLPQRAGEAPFRRFPTWMWRNTDVLAFIEWMRGHNASQERERRAGFYGLDIYNMAASIEAVLQYLDEVDSEAAAVARERYGCLTPWQREPSTYGRAVLTAGYRKCESAVIAQLRDLLQRRLAYEEGDPDSFLDAVQNARLIASAERYYRIMYYGGAESWNLRDTHMFETLVSVLNARDPSAKAVVWAHNSHIGDARHTEMGASRNELNIGQLCREHFGEEQVALIGMGTHTGTVAAASDWDGDMEIKRVNPSRADSYERQFHDAGVPRCLVDLSEDGAAVRALKRQRLERFIGVIYRPESELTSHYADASMSQQFDGFLWFDETRAVTPLGPEHQPHDGVPETYPFGL
ncbi:MAG TPA: protein-L-isoaspartate(D-aspartate) O-methyltransferase [Xanthobacteraceae bacterium]